MEGTELELFARGIRHAAQSCSGEELDAALADLGWEDAFAEDRRTAVSLVFESQGAAHTTSSSLDDVLASAVGLREAAGSAAVVLPPLGEAAPARLAGERCIVRGLATSAVTHRDTALVVAPAGSGYTAVALSIGALTTRRIGGIDPDLGLAEVHGEVRLSDAGRNAAADWPAAVSLGQLALGHELVGAARTMLELARQHALERIQFGRTISTFQAVRHRLAESLVGLEAANALLSAAWTDTSAVHAAMAKAFAGRQAKLVARHCQQVLAGIGFTAEHPFHRYVRRTIVLDQLLGAGSMLTRRLGADVLATRTLPDSFAL